MTKHIYINELREKIFKGTYKDFDFLIDKDESDLVEKTIDKFIKTYEYDNETTQEIKMICLQLVLEYISICDIDPSDNEDEIIGMCDFVIFTVTSLLETSYFVGE